MRVVVGLRPFRPDGFRIEAEPLGAKTLVHHYGHGGAGVTLSWGTARIAADLAMQRAPKAVAVIGCGVIGLATARTLQQRGVAVTIYSAATPPHTTSNVAGAFWQPVLVCDLDRMTPSFEHQLADALRESHRTFRALAPDPRYGIRELPLYYLDRDPPHLSPFMAVAPELFDGPRLAPGAHPFGDRHALVMQSMAIDTSPYLAALLADFHAAGGVLEQRSFATKHDLTDLRQTVIANCTGLGARTLVGDETLEPVRGQLVLTEPRAELSYMAVAPHEGLYLLPRADAVVLGATKNPGSWLLEPDETETRHLLDATRPLLLQ